MSVLKVKDGGSWVTLPAGGAGVPSGGSAGQILAKASGTDYATGWQDPADVGIMPFWTLLWENASPSSIFSAQTIPLDLSGYDTVWIVSKRTTSATDVRMSGFAIIDSQTHTIEITSPFTNNAFSMVRREFTPSVAGVAFGGGYLKTGTESSAASVENQYAVPLSIYGIKGVIST